MRKVLFYPDPAIQLPGHTLSKTIKYFVIMGYGFAKSIDEDWDIGVYWNLADKSEPPRDLIESGKRVLNIRCTDITKSHVEKVFSEVFGYSSLADTSQFGYCVKKSEKQSAHDGQIVRMPCEKETGYIYQLLIDNRMEIDRIYDLRIPVFLGEIPHIFVKNKSIPGTFENSLCKSKVYWVDDNEKWLTEEEIDKIIQFSDKMGLDTGEIDALRDNSTGKLYLIDVNNIPGSMLLTFIPDAQFVEYQLAMFFKEKLECLI